MVSENGNADAGGTDFQIGMHDFPGFIIHFHLLAGVSVFLEHINMWDQVESQLVLEFLHGDRFTSGNLADLLFQFGHGSRTGAAGRLIGGCMNTPDR